jgi:hypothetical protein
MATQNDFSRAFPVNTAMSAFRRVSLSSNGGLGYSQATEAGVGVLQDDVLGLAYENPKVRFYGTGSVMVAVTGGPATAGATMWAAVTGYVTPIVPSPVTAGVTFGILLAPLIVTVNGTFAEVLPLPQF